MTDDEAKQLAVLVEVVKRVEAKVDRLDHSINGNGKPGLKARVWRIEWAAGIAWAVLLPLIVAVAGPMLRAWFDGKASAGTEKPAQTSAEVVSRR